MRSNPFDNNCNLILSHLINTYLIRQFFILTIIRKQGESMLVGARLLKFGFNFGYNRMISNDYVYIPFKPINCKELAK